jgi:cytosine/adenosine deaminase-related metal-dependent hydrolase
MIMKKSRRDRDSCGAVCLALGVFCILQMPYALALDIVVHAGKLLDGISRQPRSQVSIVISGDRIVSVEPGFVDRAGARIIDLSKSTVLPGLIDCHQHIGEDVPIGATGVAVLATGLADRMIRMQANAETVLLQGFTSIRVSCPPAAQAAWATIHAARKNRFISRHTVSHHELEFHSEVTVARGLLVVYRADRCRRRSSRQHGTHG